MSLFAILSSALTAPIRIASPAKIALFLLPNSRNHGHFQVPSRHQLFGSCASSTTLPDLLVLVANSFREPSDPFFENIWNLSHRYASFNSRTHRFHPNFSPLRVQTTSLSWILRLRLFFFFLALSTKRHLSPLTLFHPRIFPDRNPFHRVEFKTKKHSASAHTYPICLYETVFILLILHKATRLLSTRSLFFCLPVIWHSTLISTLLFLIPYVFLFLSYGHWWSCSDDFQQLRFVQRLGHARWRLGFTPRRPEHQAFVF